MSSLLNKLANYTNLSQGVVEHEEAEDSRRRQAKVGMPLGPSTCLLRSGWGPPSPERSHPQSGQGPACPLPWFLGSGAWPGPPVPVQLSSVGHSFLSAS